MTVCIAAICVDKTLVIGASDRMLTGGELIEYEPPQTKTYLLTTSIVAMFSGDASLQSEILGRVHQEVNDRVRAEPRNWWLIRDVAFLYNKHYNIEKNRRAESSILAPLGLTMASFLKNQKQMAIPLVSRLTEEMVNFDMPETEAIIAGIDSTGPHIYVATGANIACHDMTGFAAIGIGSWHANSQFMFAAHSPYRPGPETMLLIFSAKKRGEVAPGVGKATDMWGIGPQLGTYERIPDAAIASLEEIYEENLDNAKNAYKNAEGRVNEFVRKIAEVQTAAQIQETSSQSESARETPTLEGKDEKNSG